MKSKNHETLNQVQGDKIVVTAQSPKGVGGNFHSIIIEIEFFASLFYEISGNAEKSLIAPIIKRLHGFQRAKNTFSVLSFMICSAEEDTLK